LTVKNRWKFISKCQKPICTKKKILSLCCLPRKVWIPTFTLPVQHRDFSFWISEWFGSQSILLIFGLREQIPSGSHHTTFLLVFYFYVKYPPISMFLGLKHNKINFKLKFRVKNLLSPASLKKLIFYINIYILYITYLYQLWLYKL
jgi:hypothetical protein